MPTYYNYSLLRQDIKFFLLAPFAGINPPKTAIKILRKTIINICEKSQTAIFFNDVISYNILLTGIINKLVITIEIKEDTKSTVEITNRQKIVSPATGTKEAIGAFTLSVIMLLIGSLICNHGSKKS